MTKIRLFCTFHAQGDFLKFLTLGSTILPRCCCILCGGRRDARWGHFWKSLWTQQWPLSLCAKYCCIFSAQFEKRDPRQSPPSCFLSQAQGLQINVFMSVVGIVRLVLAEPTAAQWSLAGSARWWHWENNTPPFALMRARNNYCG